VEPDLNADPPLQRADGAPRKIIRTIDTSEFLAALVTPAASIGFLILPSSSSELLGGVIAAPVADYIVRIMPARILGTAVGGVILVSNM
jgi:hypothetical protein